MGRRARSIGAGAGLLLFLCAAALPALDPAKPLCQYGSDSWTSDQGLPQNTVSTIAQTRDGYLWLGTQEGLARFDGVRFTTFDTRNTPAMNDDWVQALLETRDGALWIGTVAGIMRYESGRFTAPFGRPLSRAIVEALYEARDGAVWVGWEGGVSRVAGAEVKTFTTADGLPGPRVRAVAEDDAGTLWIGGTWGVARMVGGRFEMPPTREPAAPVLALQADGTGGMWIGTARGLDRLRGDAITAFSERDGIGKGLVRTLLRDREGSLWLGTDRGVFRFRDGRFLQLGTSGGLSSNSVLSLAEDREGNLWIGTADGGLDRLREQRTAIYTTRDGLSDEKAWTVIEDRRGNLWVGTADGVLNVRPAGGQAFEPAVGLGATPLAIAEDARGGLWIGTHGAGLAHLEGRRLTRFTTSDGLSSNMISTVVVDRRGVVWAGTMGSGLNRFENGRFTRLGAEDGLGSDAIFSLFEDRDGAIWVGTFGGGVSRLRDAPRRVDRFTTRDGLAHDVVMSTYQDASGTFWFGTRGGLCRYREGRFTTYRQKEGVFHDAAQRVLEDGHGYLWLTSNRGVFRVSMAELAAAGGAPGRINDRAVFTTATGMILAECNNAEHGAWRGADGRLWFATIKGLALADPARIELNRVAPAVVVEQVVANGQPAAFADGARLPAGVTKLEIRYTGLSFRNPLAVRFRYRLEGFESEWVDAGTRRTAYYTNLPPGRYRFRVRAANEDGVWNVAGASCGLFLARHVYQEPWFRALAVLALAAFAAAAYRLRVRRLEARERLRTALVEAQLDALQFQLRPHFLFNTLNSILPLIGADPERARQMVVRLGELLRLSLKSEETPLVTLDEELALLEKYLSIERVRFRDRLQVTLAVEPDAAAARVPSFLLQPLVENAIKHGLAQRTGPGRIAIQARAEGERLAIVVCDNGPGPVDTDAEPVGGIGLRNTRRRLEALYPGAHALELAPAPGGGCEARLWIPLNHDARGAIEAAAARPLSAVGG